MDLIFAATSIVPDRSAEFTVTVIIAGLGIVLATLAFLILIFALFGKAVSTAQSKAAQKKANALKREIESGLVIEKPLPAAKNEVPLPLPVTETQGTPPEVVAAISAAVYSLEGGGAKITSITRKKSPVPGRSVWAQAAIADNTKPF